MDSASLNSQLVTWSAANSGFEGEREYIGLSGIGDCSRVIFLRWKHGQKATTKDCLKTRLCYELEVVVKKRLSSLYGSDFDPTPEEVSLYDGLVQGHTDGLLKGDVVDIKTLEREEWLPHQRPSRRIEWQVQAYMRYLNRPKTQLVYLARDTGAIHCIEVIVRLHIGREIESKVERLVNAARNDLTPPCDCERCK